MAKRKVVCPECNHKFPVTVNGLPTRTAGVRARRITGDQFEYALTVPEAMSESDRFSTVSDDLILSGALAIPVGAACGLAASVVAPDYAVELVGFGASAAVTVAWGWLCAEHNQRLKAVLPWFMARKGGWKANQQDELDKDIELMVDHRYRDGHTESGRTIQYFGVLPVDVDRFNQYARAILGGDNLPGESLAFAHWTGEGKLFSRKEYEVLLALLKGGGAVINQRGKGHLLTGGGRRALRQHLKAHPPTPFEERA